MSTPLITYDDFRKVDIRVGKVVQVEDFPEARNPSFKLLIDFGPELGVKRSSGQFLREHAKEEIMGQLVLAVVNFPLKRIAGFESEVLTLGLPGSNEGWIIVSPVKEVKLGERLA